MKKPIQLTFVCSDPNCKEVTLKIIEYDEDSVPGISIDEFNDIQWSHGETGCQGKLTLRLPGHKCIRNALERKKEPS